MQTSRQEGLSALTVAAHKRVAVFARGSHHLDGRGAIRVEIPDVPPGVH